MKVSQSCALLKNFRAGLLSRPTIAVLTVAALVSWIGMESSPGAEPVDARTAPDPVKEVPATPFDAPPGTWTLAILPDTQKYTEKSPGIFLRQTEWIAAHKAKQNILFVLHEGDITQTNAPGEWEIAHQAMETLKRAKIPFALASGNHDVHAQRGNVVDRSSLLNKYFHESDYLNSEAVEYFEPGKLENTCHVFTAPQGRFLVLALEFGPRNDVLDWANKIVDEHPDCRVIVLTHAYLYCDDTRYDWSAKGAGQHANPKGTDLVQKSGDTANDGEDLWKKFVSRHRNIEFVFCGHVVFDGTGYLASKGELGNKVHQILANYQTRMNGGGGYFRLVQFLPDGLVRVKTYSPWYDCELTEPDQKFEFSTAKEQP